MVWLQVLLVKRLTKAPHTKVSESCQNVVLFVLLLTHWAQL
jgi:hypothetical protein